MENLTGFRSFTASGVITKHARVKLVGSSATVPVQVIIAGSGDQHVGTHYSEVSCASGDIITVRLRNTPGTVEMVAAGAIVQGAVVYGAASGGVDDASAGSAIGQTLAGAATGDVVEISPYNVLSTTGGTVTITDASDYYVGTDAEAILAEVGVHITSIQQFLPISLYSLREVATMAVGNIAAIGGVLASDTTPALQPINGATAGCQRVAWAAANVDKIAFQVSLPPNLNEAADLILHVRAAMAGAVDTPTIGVVSYFNEGGAAVADTVSAITGTTYAEYTATIANADVPAGAQTVTVSLTPGTHATDAMYLTALWLEYKGTLLTT